MPGIHLLGSSAFGFIAILAYFVRHMFNFISLDATSWAYFARNIQYIVPGDLRAKKIGDGAIFEDRAMICECCHCAQLGSLDDLIVQDDVYKKSILYEHNWHVTTNAMKNCFENATSAKALTLYLNSVISRHNTERVKEVGEIYRCLSLIEQMLADINNEELIKGLSTLLDKHHSR